MKALRGSQRRTSPDHMSEGTGLHSLAQHRSQAQQPSRLLCGRWQTLETTS